MFHLDRFIHQFGSNRNGAYQDDMEKNDKLECFQRRSPFRLNALRECMGSTGLLQGLL